jgi:hypothetical protein
MLQEEESLAEIGMRSAVQILSSEESELVSVLDDCRDAN